MIGETLGHYRIELKLGQGGMGVVYKARDMHLDRPVAVKVLPAEAVANSDRKRRFAQEAKAASALNHPNILHIYDIDTTGGVDFIAMEYVEGTTLEEMIGRKGLAIPDVLKCAVQIADALAAAHTVGIIHRDIRRRKDAKPSWDCRNQPAPEAARHSGTGSSRALLQSGTRFARVQ